MSPTTPNHVVPDIYAAMERLHYRYGSPHATVYRQSRVRLVESTMHEMAHAVVLGIDFGDRQLSPHVGHDIKAMTDKKADESELRTLAVEWLTMRAIGCPVSMRRLAAYATTEMRTDAFVNNIAATERGALRLVDHSFVRRRADKLAAYIHAEASQCPR